MNLKITFLLAVLMTAPAFAQRQAAIDPPAPGRWHDDVDEGYRAARERQAPLLVYFYRRLDRNCGRFERDVLATPAFAAASHGAVATRLDVDAAGAQKLLRALSIRSVPTLVVLSTAEARTKEIGRIDGTAAPGDALRTLAALVGNRSAAPAKSARISHAQLGAMIRAAGHRAEDKGNLYVVEVVEGTWTFPIEIGVAESGTYVWFSTRLLNRADIERAPRAVLVDLLAQNMRFNALRFQLGKHKLFLSMPVASSKLDQKTFADSIRLLIKHTKSTFPLWSKARHEPVGRTS